MFDMKIERIKRKIRKMTYFQKMQLKDWLDMWYEAFEEDRILHECDLYAEAE